MQTLSRVEVQSTGSYHSGFLKFEETEGTDLFVPRFFVLDRSRGLLEYFADDVGQNGHLNSEDYSTSLGHFSIPFISFVGDAVSARPKLQHAFYFIEAGVRYFLCASSESEKLDWMRILSDASRISVPSDLEDTAFPQPNGCRVEIVGGVTHTTSLTDTPRSPKPAMNHPFAGRTTSGLRENASFIKAGFCVKQGVKRKSWKRRYFVLDTFALSYYTDVQEKSPIRVIHLKDIKQARVSIGIYPSKQNLFEIVTPLRVFYLQADSPADRDSWIETINNSVQTVVGPKHSDAVTQTESDGLSQHQNRGMLAKFRFRMTSV